MNKTMNQVQVSRVSKGDERVTKEGVVIFTWGKGGVRKYGLRIGEGGCGQFCHVLPVYAFVEA